MSSAISTEQVNEILRLVKSGITAGKVAKAVGVSSKTVRIYAQDNGLADLITANGKRAVLGAWKNRKEKEGGVKC